MRVLVLENEPSSKRGGQELSLLDVCRGLAARGHQIDLLYVTPGDLLEQYRTFSSRIIPARPYTVDRSRTSRSAAGWLRNFADILPEAWKADLVYCNQYHDTLFAGLLGACAQKPVVCHLRLAPPEPICWQFRIGLRHVTRFVAISCSAKADWVAAGFNEQDIDVVHNGIDLEHYEPGTARQRLRAELGLTDDNFAVLYVGRMDPTKGFDVLLQGFSRLFKRLPTARLLAVGGPLVHASRGAAEDYMSWLKRMADQLGISGSVLWLGRRSDVPQLCDASDVLVMPSRSPEAFGRSLVEAMACGLPAVGSRIGGIPEILNGEFAQYLFPEADADCLADVLLNLSNWRSRDPGLGLRAREHVAKHFRVEYTVAGIEASLLRALKQGRKRASDMVAAPL